MLEHTIAEAEAAAKPILWALFGADGYLLSPVKVYKTKVLAEVAAANRSPAAAPNHVHVLPLYGPRALREALVRAAGGDDAL